MRVGMNRLWFVFEEEELNLFCVVPFLAWREHILIKNELPAETFEALLTFWFIRCRQVFRCVRDPFRCSRFFLHFVS